MDTIQAVLQTYGEYNAALEAAWIKAQQRPPTREDRPCFVRKSQPTFLRGVTRPKEPAAPDLFALETARLLADGGGVGHCTEGSYTDGAVCYRGVVF